MAAVQEAFDELAAMTLDATVSPIQYQESRRFFFAGVLWCICEFARQAGQPDDADGAKAYLVMESLRVECIEFGRQVKAGNA